MELKGSKTEANLWKAFAGESMARNKYTYFASKAKKEGYEQIAALFLETADNEKEHAKLWFKALDGIGDTAANLVAAAAGENEEWTSMYKEMAETARLKNLNDGMVFQKDGVYIWKCRNCGHIHVGKEAPQVCPVCAHPQAYFELKAENY